MTKRKDNIRTPRTVANIKRIIAAMRDSEMQRDDISSLLAYSPPAARKYIGDLLDNKVIVVDRFEDFTIHCRNIPIYRLNPDESIVTAFIAKLDAQPFKGHRSHGAPTNLDLAMRDPNRHFHFARDDVQTLPRLPRAKPARRDPMVAALFGGADELRNEDDPDVIHLPPLPPKPSGFAALACIRFELESV